jgi:hypothetical protein
LGKFLFSKMTYCGFFIIMNKNYGLSKYFTPRA